MYQFTLGRILGVAAVAILLGASLGWCDGPLIAPPGGIRIPLDLKRPDLVVTQMKVGTPVGGISYSALNIWVRIKNVGEATAPRTKITVWATSLTEGDATTPGTATTDTPALAVGASEWVMMPFVRSTVTQGLVAATVDPPSAGKPWGAIREAEVLVGKPAPGREVNNTFACTFVLDPAIMSVYYNPWVH